jgi:hypothetical protein
LARAQTVERPGAAEAWREGWSEDSDPRRLAGGETSSEWVRADLGAIVVHVATAAVLVPVEAIASAGEQRHWAFALAGLDFALAFGTEGSGLAMVGIVVWGVPGAVLGEVPAHLGFGGLKRAALV